MHENLLQQIQSESVSSSVDLPALLRLCRLLAQRLESEDLKKWVMYELDGYPLHADLPDYRKDNSSIIYGDFMGYNTVLKRVQIPVSSIRSPLREKICRNEFREGIPRIHNTISRPGEIGDILPADALGLITQNFLREDFVISRAWKWVSKERMGSILHTVQNRILDFTLELESQASASGDPLKQLREMPHEVKQEFHNHIMGNIGNLSQGSGNATQNITITQGDLEAVSRALADIGFSVTEADEFANVLSTESLKADGTFSQRLKEAIAKASSMAGNGAIKISQGALGSILATVVRHYFGVNG